MRIIVIVFSLVAIFMMSMSLMTGKLKTKTDNVKVKIEKWEKRNGELILSILFYTQKPIYFEKEAFCKIYNSKKEKIDELEKVISVELKHSKEYVISMGKVDPSIKYIDCSFKKEEE